MTTHHATVGSLLESWLALAASSFGADLALPAVGGHATAGVAVLVLADLALQAVLVGVAQLEALLAVPALLPARAVGGRGALRHAVAVVADAVGLGAGVVGRARVGDAHAALARRRHAGEAVGTLTDALVSSTAPKT